MANKHTATIAGHVFKRVSANRRYSHCVVIQYSVPALRAWAAADTLKAYQRDEDYLKRVANGSERRGWFTAEQNDVFQAKAAAELAAGPEGAVAERLANFDHQHKDSGDFVYSQAGWCGSRALAEKLASSQRAHNQRAAIVKVHILEAEVKS